MSDAPRELPEDAFELFRQHALGAPDLRDAAIARFRQLLQEGVTTDHPAMQYMSEVDNPVPDLALRGRLRQKLRDWPEQAPADGVKP